MNGDGDNSNKDINNINEIGINSNIPSFILLVVVTVLISILLGLLVLSYPKYKLEENNRYLEYYKSIECID